MIGRSASKQVCTPRHADAGTHSYFILQVPCHRITAEPSILLIIVFHKTRLIANPAGSLFPASDQRVTTPNHIKP